MFNIFNSKEERDKKKLQESKNRQVSATRRAWGIKQIFLSHGLIDKCLFISSNKHKLPSNIWVPLDVIAIKGVVYLEFYTSVKRHQMPWYIIQKSIPFGSDEEVINYLFVNGRNEYLQMKKDFIWANEREEKV